MDAEIPAQLCHVSTRPEDCTQCESAGKVCQYTMVQFMAPCGRCEAVGTPELVSQSFALREFPLIAKCNGDPYSLDQCTPCEMANVKDCALKRVNISIANKRKRQDDEEMTATEPGASASSRGARLSIASLPNKRQEGIILGPHGPRGDMLDCLERALLEALPADLDNLEESWLPNQRRRDSLAPGRRKDKWQQELNFPKVIWGEVEMDTEASSIPTKPRAMRGDGDRSVLPVRPVYGDPLRFPQGPDVMSCRPGSFQANAPSSGESFRQSTTHPDRQVITQSPMRDPRPNIPRPPLKRLRRTGANEEELGKRGPRSG